MNWKFVRVWISSIPRSTNFLFVLGVSLVIATLLNASIMFDDLYWPRRFSDLVNNVGWFRGAATIFSGADMTQEYRTYGLSRLLQFILWGLFGGASFVYPLIISVTQFVAAILLFKVLRGFGLSEPTALVMPALWLVSPFCVTWTFHHYSYLILPVQILILTIFMLVRQGGAARSYIVPSLLGVACALTGEMHLPIAFSALIMVALFSKTLRMRRGAWAALVAMCASLALHRIYWTSFLRDEHLAQRFNVPVSSSSMDGLGDSAWDAARAMASLLEQQSIEIFSGGVAAGIIVGLVVVIGFLFSSAELERRNGPVDKQELCAAIAFLVITMASFAVYVGLVLLLGQKELVVPRRYGFVPLTLVLMLSAILAGKIFNILSWPTFGVRRIGYAAVLFLVAALAGQFHLDAVPRQRALDRSVTAAVLDAKGSMFESNAKAALFFVASDKSYWSGLDDGMAVGPIPDRLVRRELFESPWGIYWTSRFYAENFLGFEYAAMTAHCSLEESGAKPSTLSCESNWGAPHKKTFERSNVVVVSNLSLEMHDTRGAEIKVFRSFDDFEPQNFARRIERDMLVISTSRPDDFIVDLGGTTQEANNVHPDKSFADPTSLKGAWVNNYGLATGRSSTYNHPDIRNDLVSFQSNRNGAFSYQVDLNEATDVEVSFDFWEQWGRRPGQRLFDLEISWDGLNWAAIDRIDMAAINGDKPFAVVLSRRRVKSFMFRLIEVAGSADIPVIHNLRLRRLQRAS